MNFNNPNSFQTINPFNFKSIKDCIFYDYESEEKTNKNKFDDTDTDTYNSLDNDEVVYFNNEKSMYILPNKLNFIHPYDQDKHSKLIESNLCNYNTKNKISILENLEIFSKSINTTTNSKNNDDYSKLKKEKIRIREPFVRVDNKPNHNNQKIVNKLNAKDNLKPKKKIVYKLNLFKPKKCNDK